MPVNATATNWPLDADDLHVLKFIAVDTAVDLSLYGVQTTLSISAIAILARRQGRSRRFTLAAVLGLLLSSTITTAVRTVFYLVQFPFFGKSEAGIQALLRSLNILMNVTATTNYVLSDGVLAWRALCLWPDSRIVKGILASCLCGSIVGSIAECTWLFWPGPNFVGGVENIYHLLLWLLPLIVTNAVATALIGKKVLQYRREIQGSLGPFAQRTQAGTVLLLLLESGIAYMLFWVIDCALTIATLDSPFSDIHVFGSIAFHIAGIYPTCVLFVAIRRPTESLISAQVSQAMHFEGPAERPRESGAVSDSTPEGSAGVLDIGHQDLHADSLSGWYIADDEGGVEGVEIEAELTI
ncbi:hypothetical protein GGF50DRAFT_50947 [Schizophyllum commune]